MNELRLSIARQLAAQEFSFSGQSSLDPSGERKKDESAEQRLRREKAERRLRSIAVVRDPLSLILYSVHQERKLVTTTKMAAIVPQLKKLGEDTRCTLLTLSQRAVQYFKVSSLLEISLFRSPPQSDQSMH
jgi:hypothetical protein